MPFGKIYKSKPTSNRFVCGFILVNIRPEIDNYFRIFDFNKNLIFLKS